MTICYYITGHGFGHAIRATQVMKALPLDVRLIVKTTVPERLFRDEMPGRALTYIAAEYDCGCMQSDSVTVLPRETLARYRQISAHNHAHLAEEVAFLQRENVQCVVSDVPAFPLFAAERAGVPSIAVANFTWHDIYQEYTENGEDARLLDEMAAEYGAATVALITPLATPTAGDPFPNVETVPLIARSGRNIRMALTEKLGTIGRRHLALLYLGTWGLEIDWSKLATLQDWAFLTEETPSVVCENVITFDRSLWSYADIAASVDVVVSKAGYGTVTGCIAAGVPLVYVPRTRFAEYSALVTGMERWGGGIPILEQDFLAGRWQNSLEDALQANLDPNAYQIDGARVVAERILTFR